MNRRFFMGLVAQFSGAVAVGFFGKSADAGTLNRKPASAFTDAYGYYGGYGNYGIYGIYGGYDEYGSYGVYGGYNEYGSYGQFGAYGSYGVYGVYGYGPYIKHLKHKHRSERMPNAIKKADDQSLQIDFSALTNRKA